MICSRTLKPLTAWLAQQTGKPSSHLGWRILKFYKPLLWSYIKYFQHSVWEFQVIKCDGEN
jgi:hypothetical protein